MSSRAERYVDAAGHEAYEDNDGQELVVAKLVPGSPAQAFDAWIQHAWVAPFSTLRDGRGRGHVGHQRGLIAGSVVEEIVSVGEPEEDGAGSDRIPSVCYKLRKFGPFPLKDHIGLVSFVPDASAPRDLPATLILWTVKITPTTFGNITTCGGSLVRLLLRTIFHQNLDAVSAAVRTARLTAATKSG
jgi:hypothetical protein